MTGQLFLTRIGLASFLWDKGKQYSPRCDAANPASHLGLFCLLRNENGHIQMIMRGESIHQKWVEFMYS